MFMPFGKHQGQHVREVPTSYLRWVLREVETLDRWQRHAIEAELSRRGEGPRRHQEEAPFPPPADFRALFRTWFAGLARDYHPDRIGGDGREMVAINDAAERLKKLAGIA
jgi:hypothetical protein